MSVKSEDECTLEDAASTCNCIKACDGAVGGSVNDVSATSVMSVAVNLCVGCSEVSSGGTTAESVGYMSVSGACGGGDDGEAFVGGEVAESSVYEGIVESAGSSGNVVAIATACYALFLVPVATLKRRQCTFV